MMSDMPRWRTRHFGYWQPYQLEDGSWAIAMDRKGEDPVRFIDLDDQSAGHIMSEDESVERARGLNAIGFRDETDAFPTWKVVPKDRPFVALRIAQPEVIIRQLVDRFLSWPLPDGFAADPCATDPTYQHPRHGTNLLSADQADDMFREVLAGIPFRAELSVDAIGLAKVLEPELFQARVHRSIERTTIEKAQAVAVSRAARIIALIGGKGA